MRIAVQYRVVRECLSAKSPRVNGEASQMDISGKSRPGREKGLDTRVRERMGRDEAREGAGSTDLVRLEAIRRIPYCCAEICLFITPALQHLFCPLADPKQVYFPLNNLKQLRTDPSSTPTLFSSYTAPHFPVGNSFVHSILNNYCVPTYQVPVNKKE